MAGMKNKILTWIAALGMVTAPLTEGQAAENISMDTSKDLITAINGEAQWENWWNELISYDEAQKDLERKQEIRAILEKEMNTWGLRGVAHEIKDLEEKYGKNFVIEQVNALVKVIEGDLDKFWSFDSKGNYSLDEEKVSELVKNIYQENNIAKDILNLISGILVIVVSILVIYDKKKNR